MNHKTIEINISIIIFFRYQKFDQKYIKKWLLREQPEEKLDIRLWQTFRNIDLQTAIKLHEETPATKQTVTQHSPKLLAIVNPPNGKNRKGSIVPFMFVFFNRLIHNRIVFFFSFSSLTGNDGLIRIGSIDEEFSAPVDSNNIKDLLQSTMHYTHRRVRRNIN
jgi:hypothetical protein